MHPLHPKPSSPERAGAGLTGWQGQRYPARAPSSSPHPPGIEEPWDTISLMLGNHRTRFACLSPHRFTPAPDFTPVYTIFSSLVVATTHTPCSIIPPCHRSLSPGLSPPPGIKPPRGTNTFPPCSHSPELPPASATHLSSAQRVLPTHQTAEEATDPRASTRLRMLPKTTSTAAGTPKFNPIDTGHQLVFAHMYAACRMSALEGWQNK